MKSIFHLLLFVLPLGLFGQDKGINFEHELSWKEVQAKAKAENKYIFMDCFTTWCGPCKYMTANVFPQEKMGDYFNKNFVNVKVQMDVTAGDAEDVKKWYDDAKAIADQYGIAAYPTFLYFSPDGKLVHRVVGGGEADEFIAKSSDALDPTKQYYTLLENFDKKAVKLPKDIRDMAIAADKMYERKVAAKYAQEYLATQTNLMTKENIEFMSTFVKSSKDKEFAIFQKQGAEVDKIMGAGTTARFIKSIIVAEEITPVLRAAKTTDPDWKALQAAITKKYPTYSDELVSYYKVLYYQSKKDWPNFQTAVVPYMQKYGKDVSARDLNSFAWNIFENCPDMKCVGDALEWSKRSVDKQKNPQFMDTYANILYKLGKKDEAIAMLEKALALAKDQKPYQETLDKMKNGESTWKQ